MILYNVEVCASLWCSNKGHKPQPKTINAMYTVKKIFRMSKQEVEQYNALPDNLPSNRLSERQKELVSSLYRKYIQAHIDNRTWSRPMYKEEQLEKWPSGPRLKDHEAKRIILTNLIEQQGRKLTDKEAAQKFHSALTCRPMYAKLLSEVFTK